MTSVCSQLVRRSRLLLAAVLAGAAVLAAGSAASPAAAATVDGMLVFDADYLIEFGFAPDQAVDTLARRVFAVGPGARGVRPIGRERPGWVRGRVFSPDGRWLMLFRADRGLFVGPASGRSAPRLVAGTRGASWWALGPSGRTVAYSTASHRLFVVSRDGKGRRQVARRGIRPLFSASGRLAFLFDDPIRELAALCVLEPDGGVRELFSQGVVAADWSPDAQQLVALRFDPDNTGSPAERQRRGRFTVELVDAAGGPARVVARTNDTAAPQFSPDGRSLAFARGGDIYVVPTAGQRARRLVATERLFDDVRVSDGYEGDRTLWSDVTALEWLRAPR